MNTRACCQVIRACSRPSSLGYELILKIEKAISCPGLKRSPEAAGMFPLMNIRAMKILQESRRIASYQP